MSDLGYAWHPIQDLPDDWEDLSDPEIPALGRLWLEQRERMADAAAVEQFSEQIRREWAIETGIIERLYDLDRGITRVLIEQGLDASLIPHGASDKPAEEVIAIIRDQHAAVEGLLDFVGSGRALSTSYIKALHQVLTAHQETTEAVNGEGRWVQVPLRRGDWKQWPNSPVRPNGTVHEYCPPEQVASEMDRLIAMHAEHLARGVPPEVESAWLHHRFSQIHPFQDGNGRVARCLSTLIFLKASWFPLVVRRDDRAEYIGALEAADHGDLSRLIALFVRIQKAALIHAIGISDQIVTRTTSQTELISSIVARLREKRESRHTEMNAVVDLVAPLIAIARDRLQPIRDALEATLAGEPENLEAIVFEGPDEGDKRHWFRWQVISAARKLGYWADLGTYHSWLRLRLRVGDQGETNVIVSFHSYGETFRGVLACTVFSYRREPGEEQEFTTSEVTVACRDFFQLNYIDKQPAVEQRFESWLREALAAAIEDWGRRL